MSTILIYNFSLSLTKINKTFHPTSKEKKNDIFFSKKVTNTGKEYNKYINKVLAHKSLYIYVESYWTNMLEETLYSFENYKISLTPLDFMSIFWDSK